jgi:flavin reductase (DIM6/NTAB) family NADH-FMN oxidoreductase RutF
MDTVTPERFREVLGHVPTSVVVVTATGPEGPAAMAIGSFVSVSLDPLLVGFLPAKSSSSWPAIRSAHTFCVNVLADDQTELSRTFAMRGGDKFAGVEWRPSPSGAPIIDGCVAWIECAPYGELDAGDHVFVLGQVIALDLARDAHALVFHRGDYTSTAAAAIVEGRG